jgi:tRNA-uridine 2-sulfurtransferase
MRVVVAMSGGVDSSVAAALLAEQGHDVIGVSMQLYPSPGDGAAGAAPDRHYGTCCTIDDLHDARRVASAIGIPHYILNFESRFDETVVANFVREYAAGRTPIPCAHCNSEVKFASLLERAIGFGADVMATGHYARITRDEDGRFRLRRGLDPGKDQSYFLFSLTQDQMARALFPIGELDKATVRAHARRLGLQVAGKPDSQEICFVPDGDYAGFLEREAPELARPGAIVSAEGRVVGTHDGVHRFTVGQRKGLRLTSAEPLYVLAIDAPAARVVVGAKGRPAGVAPARPTA